MSGNPVLKLQDFGQSIWLDFLRRGLLTSGELQALIDNDGVRGVTSNPAIFKGAIVDTDDYDEAIAEIAGEGLSSVEMYERIAIEDIQRATDFFRPMYDFSDGLHGYVSLEVDPHLARDTEGTIEEGRRLWVDVDRPNLLIKVPATSEGLPAIRQLISEGINVNVTLLFSIDRYREVAEAYISGLEQAVATGEPIHRVCSVASFFLSRIDSMVDALLEEKIAEGGENTGLAEKLCGEVAIASAKIAYQIHREMVCDSRWRRLADRGARIQRLLWASTSTKNPEYSDVRYVEALIGPQTINTLPMATLEAYRDHGDPAERLEEGIDEAREVIDRLPEVGIDLDAVTAKLVEEGIEKFNQPYDELIETLEQAASEAASG